MGGMRECLKILSMNTKRNLVIAVSFRLFLCGNVYDKVSAGVMIWISKC